MSKSQRNYCFTSFSESEPKFTEGMRYLIYQKEQCPHSGKLHWQGYVELHNKLTMNGVKTLFNDNTIHLEIRRGTREQARAYCMKPDSQCTPPVEHGDWKAGGRGSRTDLHKLVSDIENGSTDYELLKTQPETVERYRTFIKHARNIINEHKSKEYIQQQFPTHKELNKVQTKIMEHIATQNERQVTWVYDEEGGCGKTWLSKYLIANCDAIRFTNGKTKDISYAYNNNPIVVFDFARSCEDRINYQIIEDLKNGILFSTKYESKQKIFAPPKIVIMANFHPNKSALSKDRWDIINISAEGSGNTDRAHYIIAN